MSNSGDEDTLLNTATSPDGALRVDAYCFQPERMVARYRLVVHAADGVERAIPLGYAPNVGPVEFGPGGESLRFTLRRDGRPVPVEVDVRAWTFRLRDGDRPEPVAALPDRLEREFPPPRGQSVYIGPPPTVRRLLATSLAILFALVLVAGGLWMLLTRPVAERGWWGALLAVVLFGAGAFFEIKDLREMVRARRRNSGS